MKLESHIDLEIRVNNFKELKETLTELIESLEEIQQDAYDILENDIGFIEYGDNYRMEVGGING